MSASVSNPKTSVKVVGANGQVSLGKEYAGRQVLVEEREAGVWLIRTARVIPDNELWLHGTRSSEDLRRALVWASEHPPKEADPDKTLGKLENARERGTRKTRHQ